MTVVGGPSRGKSDITVSTGHYALVGVEGAFTVQITKDGYASSTRQVTVPETVTLHVEITPLAPPADVSGTWTVTFEPHPTCPDFTRADARRYRVSIVQQGAQLGVALSGATFATPPQLVGTIHGANMSLALPGGCTYYCYYGPPESPAVIESVADNRFLAISGLITATAGPILDYRNPERAIHTHEDRDTTL